MKMLYLDLFRSNLRMFSFFLNEKPRFKISVNRKNLKSASAASELNAQIMRRRLKSAVFILFKTETHAFPF